MSSKNFTIVDVFTNRPFAGNQLAVFPYADGLDGATMQAIAREFHFSETTFVFSPRAAGATRRLRCFSPRAEVFGAGHNALGAWWVVLNEPGAVIVDDKVVWQELGDRVLPIAVSTKNGVVRRLTMAQLQPTLRRVNADRSHLASALGLSIDAFSSTLELCVAKAGATKHLLVPVPQLDDVRRIRVDARQLISIAKRWGCEGCYAFCLDTVEPNSIAHARGFFPSIGIAEDPATGSAAGPLAAFLVERGLAPSAQWLTIEQGDCLGRPSRIEARVSDSGVEVGGACAIVATGQVSI